MSNRRLLLISNSTLYGSSYLDHCLDPITLFLGNVRNILFVPYARPSGITHEEYTAKARAKFIQIGYELTGIHEMPNPVRAVSDAEALFIGGGNTFVLLDELYKNDLVPILRGRVTSGVPYIGTSAGANVAGQTIRTTNDMPIAHPRSLDALRLVPFNINPHYLDPDPSSRHQGETRETRIKEFHVFNATPVVALREGAMLRVERGRMMLKGIYGSRVFRQDQEPQEFKTGDDMSFLL